MHWPARITVYICCCLADYRLLLSNPQGDLYDAAVSRLEALLDAERAQSLDPKLGQRVVYSPCKVGECLEVDTSKLMLSYDLSSIHDGAQFVNSYDGPGHAHSNANKRRRNACDSDTYDSECEGEVRANAAQLQLLAFLLALDSAIPPYFSPRLGTTRTPQEFKDSGADKKRWFKLSSIAGMKCDVSGSNQAKRIPKTCEELHRFDWFAIFCCGQQHGDGQSSRDK